MAVACAIQASLGFGAALLAAPVLRLIHPAFAPGPIIASMILLTALVAAREHSRVDVGALRFVVAGRIVGNAVAAWLLTLLSQAAFDAALGAIVLAGVALSVGRRSFSPGRTTLTTAGFASGVMGTLSSIGGPPVALVYPHDDPGRFRATLSAHFIVGGALSLVAIGAVGRFGTLELALSALLVPPVLAGFWLSRFTLRHVDATRLRRGILGLSSVAGLLVLGRALVASG